MDDQHKKIVELLNKMHAAKKAGSGKWVLNEILVELADYVDVHFKEEENLLEANDCPQLAAEQKAHAKLKDDLLELKQKFNNGNATLSSEVLIFLKNWLNGHILGLDKQYGTFLNAKGIN
jgi:hemerythrin-like metal-binding protein